MLIKIENGQAVGLPITEREFRSIFYNVSFPSPLSLEDVIERGYAFYQDSLNPPPGRYEVVEKSSPVKVFEGLWERGWSIREMNAIERQKVDEDKKTTTRLTRNAKLSETDWTQLADAPVDSSAWAFYRQELRDIPEQEGFPWDIIWPDEPEA